MVEDLRAFHLSEQAKKDFESAVLDGFKYGIETGKSALARAEMALRMLKFIHKNEYNPNLQHDLFGEYNQNGGNIPDATTWQQTLRTAQAVDSIRVLIHFRLEQNFLNSSQRLFIESRIFGFFVRSSSPQMVDVFESTENTFANRQ